MRAAIKHLFASRVFWLSLALAAVYAVLAIVVPSRPWSEGWRVIQTSVGAFVFLAYAPAGLACFTLRGWPARQNWLALGVTLIAYGFTHHGAWSLFWRLSGQPLWVINNDWYSAWIVFVVAGMTILILTPNLFGAGVANRERATLAAAWIVAAGIIAVLMIAQPDLRPLADWLRPYLDGD